MYRPPYNGMTVFQKFCKKFAFRKWVTSDVLDYESNKKVYHFSSSIFHYNMIPTMSKPTHVTRSIAAAIDHIITNTLISGIQHRSGIMKNDISEHFPFAFALNTCEKSNPKDKVQFIYKCTYREEQIESFMQVRSNGTTS